MKRLTPFLFFVSGLFFHLNGQPCIRIESLLVDACGNPEGENEMVRFRTGNSSLNTANLSATWPTNGWLGICQNAQTAASVAQINAGITQCGFVMEPPGGILPPQAQVVLVTSTNFNPTFNPFTALSDTIYMIFQCAGNAQGHLANATSTGVRTVSLSFSSPAGCSQSVSYDCGLLTDIFGNTGITGNTPSDRDGAAVVFAPNGVPSYPNAGCQAPIVPGFVDAGNAQTGCAGDTIWLTGTASSVFQTFQWSGGNGVFTQPNQLVTGYVISALDFPLVNLTLTGTRCNGTLSDGVTLNINPTPSVQIQPAGLIGICNGSPVTLNATATGPVIWSNGTTGNSANFSAAGWVRASTSNGCGIDLDSVQLADGLPPNVQISNTSPGPYCPGDQVLLTANSASQVTWGWSTGANGATIQVSGSGTYTATATNACGTNSAAITINFTPAPQLNIVNPPNTILCTGQTLLLDAQGNGTIQWNGQNINPLPVSTGGVYTAMVTNPCGVVSQQLNVIENPLPSISYTGIQPIGICQGQSLNLAINSNVPTSWNTGATGSSILVMQPGTYQAIGQNACGSDTLTLLVQSSNLQVGLSASPLIGISPVEVIFTPSWTGADTVRWDVPAVLPGNGGIATVLYDTMATITYTLTGVDTFGCAAYASISLQIAPDRNYGFFVPNTFTPNGDGLNDVFKAHGFGITTVKGIIVNRWGEIIYEIGDLAHAWDGRMSLDEWAPNGVYTYRFEVQNKAFETFTFMGQINLIR